MLTKLQTTNYKKYPECMFAMLSAFVEPEQADVLRSIAGDAVFRTTDSDGNTYKNGLLHSFNDEPAYFNNTLKAWYRDGRPHRDGDLPAVIHGDCQEWWKNGELYRENEQPVIINRNQGTLIKNGETLVGFRDEEGNWTFFPKRKEYQGDEEYSDDEQEYSDEEEEYSDEEEEYSDEEPYWHELFH